MGRSQRRKGHDFERAVCKMFADAGFAMKRVLDETRDGNCGDVRGDAPLVAQCKVGARPPIWEAVQEAEAAAKDGEYAVAVLRRNRAVGRGKQDVVAMPLADFLEIAAILKRERIW